MSLFLITLLQKATLFSFWFAIGNYSHIKFLPLKQRIYSLSFIELFFITYFLYILCFLTGTLITEYVFNLSMVNIDSVNLYMVEGGNAENPTNNSSASIAVPVQDSSSSTPATSSTSAKAGEGVADSQSSGTSGGITPNQVNSNFSHSSDNNTAARSANVAGKAADGAIMSLGLSAGLKLSQHVPSIAGKAAAIASGIAMGGAAMAAKNISGNYTEDIGRKASKFIGSYEDLIQNLHEFYNLTDNNGLNLLLMIQQFQRLQLIFLFVVFYNLLITKLNLDKLEDFLLKIFPGKLVHFYVKSLRLIQKSSSLLLILMLILLLISNLYSYYYLNFFIVNLEDFVSLYFTK